MVGYERIESGGSEDTGSSTLSISDSSGEILSLKWKISTFVLLNLCLFVSYGLFCLPGSFLPLYNLDRDIPIVITGVILGTVPFCYIFICPLVAKLLDSYSSKTLLLLSTGLVSMVTLAFATLGYVKNNTLYIALCLLLRVFQGITGGVIDVVAFAVTAKMFPSNIALTTAVVETSLNCAIATSPYIGARLYESMSFLMAFVIPAAAIFVVFLTSIVCVKDVSCRKSGSDGSSKGILTDPLIMFPAWHCAFCQTLLNFYIPILAAYTQEEFGRGAVFAGECLLVNTAGIIIVALFLGQLMDMFNPYIFFVISAFTLPVTYLFLGPSHFLLGLLGPSTTQLLVVLAFIGLEMCLACFPSLIIMYDIYKVRYRKMPQSAQNLITSIYCASFPVGAFVGAVSSGIMSQYLTFANSTMTMGIIAVVESFVLFGFCFAVRRLKNRTKQSGEACPILKSGPSQDMEIHYNE
ncbi:hypothetical protein ACHWQZ_G017075 [Mnemiopsis leidyi]